MLIALCERSSRLCAGHTSTHTPQPVQSSGATRIVISLSSYSLPDHSTLSNSFGAPSRSEGSKAFMRIAACGQTNAQRPHWMHTSGSQIGISGAMERFSQRAVSVGKVPSIGIALTGSRSPLPAIISDVTF